MNERCKSAIALGLWTIVGACWPTPCISADPISDVTDQAAPPISPVTDEEAMETGSQMARAIQKGNAKGFVGLFDLKSLTEAIHVKSVGIGSTPSLTKYKELPAKTRESMESEVARIVEEFAVRAIGDKSLDLLSTNERMGRKQVVLRAIKRDGAPTYYEVTVRRRGKDVKGSDLYLHLLNEWLSNIVRFDFKKGDEGLRPVAQGDNPTEIELNDGLRAMLDACKKGDQQRAVEYYRSLPSDDRERRAYLFFLISALKEPSFQFAVDEANRLCAKDMQINISLVGAFQKHKRWDESLQALQRVETGIGGDPYLGAWGAQILLDAGKPERAKELIVRILDHRPGDWHTDCWILTNCLKRSDYSQAVDVLRAIDREFVDGTADRMKFDEFPDFLKSPEFLAWKKSRAAKE